MSRHSSPPGFPAAAYGLLTDQAHRVLIVQPRGADDGTPWRLPGGLVEADETPRDALERELREELALDRPAGSLLVQEWVLPLTPGRRPRMTFLFGTSPVTPQEAGRILLEHGELAACRWVPLEIAVELLHERHSFRLTRACAGPVPAYLEHRPQERHP
ncbi:NUDIX hydrolase [Streptomyces albus subsp. chlorinus]|uniref:NUDIX domain-containing protein n=1 Tax=Streptomyces albus TaxID=1888 RepID=UPI00156ED708|nr:NUDIX hydrolase [Streptomyces albus]NSC20136.1 NUDIX hydrolase [Streptomyces albus subsp. chlorinus]